MLRIGYVWGPGIAAFQRVPEVPESHFLTAEPSAKEPCPVFEELSQVVLRAMIAVAELQEIQERVHKMSERISKLTPLPSKVLGQPETPSEIVP
jgi:hypothetical protein